MHDYISIIHNHDYKVCVALNVSTEAYGFLVPVVNKFFIFVHSILP